MSNETDKDEIDQDAAAAEWAASLGADDDVSEEDEAALAAWAGAADEGGDTGRELNQDEIDSLLGVKADKGKADQPGILSLVNRRDVTYERLPMLEVVFDRLERMMTTSVRNFTSENVDVNLENITAQRFGDYLNSVPLPAMISIFRAVEWDNFGLITIDSPLIYAIVDVLLGGRRGMNTMRVEGRPYTTIETSLIERLVHIVLHDLTQAFQPVAPVEFRFDRMETNPRFAAIARPNNACVVFKMRLETHNRGGCVTFIIPYATLEPARDRLLQGFMGEKFGRDAIWENHLAREIWVTEVDLEAVLDTFSVPLGHVADLEVGDVLPLTVAPDAEVVLRCGNVPMMQGRIGQIGDKVAVQVEERIARDGGTGHG